MTHIERTDRTDLPITAGNFVRDFPAARIFELLDLSYDLQHFEILPKTPSLDVVSDLFEDAVSILAALAENRIRRGLYRRHVERPEDLRFIPNRTGSAGWLQKAFGEDPYLRCRYDGSISDFEDNEILLWALYTASKAELSRDGLARNVRHSYRAIAGSMLLTDENANIGITRFYRRLGNGGRPIHGLCRLILEHLGPGLRNSAAQPVPLTVNMSALFQAFMVAWLEVNLAQLFDVRVRSTVQFGAGTGRTIGLDIAIEDRTSRQTVMVLETTDATPTDAEIHQAAARVAVAGPLDGTGSPVAILAHPATRTQEVRVNVMRIDGVTVRTVGFDLTEDLSAAGVDFLERIGLNARSRR